MALRISKNAELTDVIEPEFLEDGTTPNPEYTGPNPITTQHINTGESKVVQLWVFHNREGKTLQDVVIDPVDTSGSDETEWFELSLDGVTYGAPGASLNIGDIETANVGVRFFLRVTNPSVADSQNKTDLVIEVTGREFAV